MLSLLSAVLLCFSLQQIGAKPVPCPRSLSSESDPSLLNYPYVPPYNTLPATPVIPTNTSGYVSTSAGAKIWYALNGVPLKTTLAAKKNVVVFLHGGFGNSNYFALQIAYLALLDPSSGYTMLSIDSRGHGRSVDGTVPITYDLMTKDVIAVLDYLSIPKVAVIGWSDGAILGFDMAMNYTSRIDRLFSYGGTYSPNNINASIGDSPSFNAYLNRVEGEYKALNPDPGHWQTFSDKMNTMWAALPTWDSRAFAKIPTLYNSKTAPFVWIVDGEREDAVTLDTPRTLEYWIPGSQLVLLPAVSHFGFLQDPVTWTAALLRFLTYH